MQDAYGEVSCRQSPHSRAPGAETEISAVNMGKVWARCQWKVRLTMKTAWRYRLSPIGFGGMLTTLRRTLAFRRHKKLGIHGLLKLRIDYLGRRTRRRGRLHRILGCCSPWATECAFLQRQWSSARCMCRREDRDVRVPLRHRFFHRLTCFPWVSWHWTDLQAPSAHALLSASSVQCQAPLIRYCRARRVQHFRCTRNSGSSDDMSISTRYTTGPHLTLSSWMRLRGQGVTLEIVIILHLSGLDLHRSRPALRRKLRPAR